MVALDADDAVALSVAVRVVRQVHAAGAAGRDADGTQVLGDLALVGKAVEELGVAALIEFERDAEGVGGGDDGVDERQLNLEVGRRLELKAKVDDVGGKGLAGVLGVHCFSLWLT